MKNRILGLLSTVVEENGQVVIQNVTLELKKLEHIIMKGMKGLQNALFCIFILISFYVANNALNMAYEGLVVKSNVTPWQIFSFTVETGVLLYLLNSLFRFTLKPSLSYTKLLDELHQPNVLWSISKCYSGAGIGTTDFYYVMEHQRKRIIWVLLGIPISSQTYHKVMGGFGSAIITIIAIVIRGMVM